jgi:hypothetical protein
MWITLSWLRPFSEHGQVLWFIIKYCDVGMSTGVNRSLTDVGILRTAVCNDFANVNTHLSRQRPLVNTRRMARVELLANL